VSLIDAALALALEAHAAEEATRVEVIGTPVEQIIEAMRKELTPTFQRGWDDEADTQAWLTGKRMGKSEYGGRRLFRGAALNPRSVNPYIGPTAKAARLRMWPIIKRIAAKHFPEARIREDMMTATLPGGGVVVVGGCENKNDIGNWFGMPFAEAFVDECGTFPSYIAELVADGLEPSLMDFKGKIVMAGNPGVAPTGYWYEMTGPKRLAKLPLFKGDARDNPHVDAASYFAKKLDTNGWTEEHPTFQRMYLGEWAWDPSAMCFPYKHERNAVECLPERSLGGGPLEKAGWRFVIAADVAGLGVTAIVVIAVHPMDPRTFAWSAENHNAWLPEQLVARVEQIKADRSHGYDMSKAAFVCDVGGLGSVHNLHMTRKAGHLFHEHADKADKKSWIRDMHDELLSGRMCAVWHQCQPLIDEWAVLEWNEKHDGWEDGPPDHCTDASGYGKRRSWHFTRAANTAPETDPDTLLEREAERLKAAHMRRMTHGRSAGIDQQMRRLRG
jgi:hypothetical protein